MRAKLLLGMLALLGAAFVVGACSLSQVVYGVIGAPPAALPTAIVVTVMVSPLAPTPGPITPTPTPLCAVQQGWFNYVVQPGDTLARIAARSNTSAAALAQANCLANMNVITVGQVLKVPVMLALSPTPVAPTAPPSRIPLLEQGVTSPDGWMNADAGNYRLRAGATVNVTWYDAPGGLISVTFYTTSMRGTRQEIGVDTNPSDGITVPWTVPYGLNAHQLRAEGPGLGAAAFDFAVSFPSYVYSDISPDQCYVEILADQPLYERPDITTAVVGTAPGGTVWPVIASTTDGWVGIELNLGWLPPTGPVHIYGSTCP